MNNLIKTTKLTDPEYAVVNKMRPSSSSFSSPRSAAPAPKPARQRGASASRHSKSELTSHNAAGADSAEQEQRLIDLGKLAAEIAHDFANTLLVVANSVAQLRLLLGSTVPLPQPTLKGEEAQKDNLVSPSPALLEELEQLEATTRYADWLISDLLLRTTTTITTTTKPQENQSQLATAQTSTSSCWQDLSELIEDHKVLLELFTAAKAKAKGSTKSIEPEPPQGQVPAPAQPQPEEEEEEELVTYRPGPALAWVRPLDVLRILTNLVSNAAHAVQNTVGVETGSVSTNRGRAKITISTGLRWEWETKAQSEGEPRGQGETRAVAAAANKIVAEEEELDLEAGQHPQLYAYFEVADNGPGLDEVSQARLLACNGSTTGSITSTPSNNKGKKGKGLNSWPQTAPWQGAGPDGSGGVGFGLGLSAIAALIKANGWLVRIETSPGGGTTVCVLIATTHQS